MSDKLRESCGIFGVYAPGEDVARVTFFASYALQHRGQESAGIATADGESVYCHTSMGLVSQIFDEEILSNLKGYVAIGHNRYSTTGSNNPANAQPIVVQSDLGKMALGHNGNITNAVNLKAELMDKGYPFHSSTDSEVIANLIASSPGRSWTDKIIHAMGRLEGAYSLVILTKDRLIGVRDSFGFRPLSLGRMNGHYLLASESCAFDHIGAEPIRDVDAGEVVAIDATGIKSFRDRCGGPQAFCAFEYIYLARPDSVIMSKRLYEVRLAMGARLAEEYPIDADLVMGVPDSATAAAIGYSARSGIPYTEGVVKNRYVGRTFIQPDQRLRELGVKIKFNPLPEILNGKRVIVVDDSIVRGTTTPHLVSLLRRAGAREIHMRICAPPIRYPCFFGVDMATRRELIAAQRTIPEIADYIGADSLGYLSIPGLLQAIGMPRDALCLACFLGEYPIPVQLEMDKLALEVRGS